ncbi:MAG: relaxasome subunit MobC [Lachnospiraceae bacterium]|nr:relaxasome subunit MobC [Lachnospiraceae bacterium]MDO4966912.1 relaxasome subunit MobC [Lachnospiraceae bacterium]
MNEGIQTGFDEKTATATAKIKKKKTLEEKIMEKDQEFQKYKEKARQAVAEKKRMEKEKKEKERKANTHRKIMIGGTVEKIIGRSLTDEDLIRFQNFLYQQERRGEFFTRAMSEQLSDGF